jgi:transcriptional regulator with XRE-family HTH domain
LGLLWPCHQRQTVGRLTFISSASSVWVNPACPQRIRILSERSTVTVLRNSDPQVKSMIARIVKPRRDTQIRVATKTLPGQKRFTTVAWCDLVDAELKDRGWNRSRLARELGLAKPIISRVLNRTHLSSPYVDAICHLLAVPPPEMIDDRDAEVIGNMRRLRTERPAEYDKIAAKIAAALASPKKPPGN